MGSVFFEGLSPGDWIQSKGAASTSNRDPLTLNISTEDLKRKRKKDFSFQKLTLMWPTVAFISVPFSLVRSRHHISPRLLFSAAYTIKYYMDIIQLPLTCCTICQLPMNSGTCPLFFSQCHLCSVSSLRPANFLVIND